MTGAKREELLADMPGEDEKGEDQPAGPPASDLHSKLRAIAGQAVALRKAGVLRVTVGEVAFDLLPYVEPPPAGDEPERPDLGDLRSPALYSGGVVPTLPRPPRFRGEEEFDGEDS